jgi:hypothetical protein
MNGDHAPRVPDDLVWDEDNPPVVYECSQDITHEMGCNGNCNSTVLNEEQVELMNEARAWARAGMSFYGIPTAYAGQIPVRGINVELFDLECKLQVFRELLIESLGIDEEEVESRFRRFKFQAMRHIREVNEAAVRRARMEQFIPKKQILGPDGGPIIQ